MIDGRKIRQGSITSCLGKIGRVFFIGELEFLGPGLWIGLDLLQPHHLPYPWVEYDPNAAAETPEPSSSLFVTALDTDASRGKRQANTTRKRAAGNTAFKTPKSPTVRSPAKGTKGGAFNSPRRSYSRAGITSPQAYGTRMRSRPPSRGPTANANDHVFFPSTEIRAPNSPPEAPSSLSLSTMAHNTESLSEDPSLSSLLALSEAGDYLQDMPNVGPLYKLLRGDPSNAYFGYLHFQHLAHCPLHILYAPCSLLHLSASIIAALSMNCTG
jgi:hypothetical protein